MSEKNASSASKFETPEVSNFLRQIIDQDLAQGKHAQRLDAHGKALPSVITRFPPEPNGYLHIGHAKSICLNFGLAKDYASAPGGARCHMRFDDTNPSKEETEYVDSILDAVQWLGFSWESQGVAHQYYASDYFDRLYEYAEILIQAGKAYVDSQSADEIHKNRGNFGQLGINSPYRDRTSAENLELFRAMRAGKYADGAHVLRLKIDMAHPNIVMRDPVIYRIRHAHHHRTGDQWCIYPLYDFTHCISDAIENITHSICTLEFENNRPLYDWVLEALRDAGVFKDPLPKQYEFARLNLTYAITSKRKLLQLVEEKRVDGWDDPRMPTIVGIRRRGYTPESIQLFCERIGVSKAADSWIDMSVLEQALRDDLEPKAPRAFAVLKPLKLIIDNFADDHAEPCSAPRHPQHPEWGERHFHLTKEVWIEADDFMIEPSKGFFRLYPPQNGQAGNRVRLRHGFVIECTGYDTNDAGEVVAVHAQYFPDSKSGTAGSNNYKVKGNLHWVSAKTGIPAEIRVYDRLFTDPHPDSGDKDFLQALNTDSKQVLAAYIEEGLNQVESEARYQFERHGYFVADRIDHTAQKAVFNLIVNLKDNWK
ncbi:glutamine--tRNA ligase/YqeY domain fusion protein [Polynucleobacter sp. MWH-Loch1C5]|uniref:glutamine--tRNA ligase/YqeY domain fusion protein n=1 Tax=Polynucleobacter sp. MWH-Loch1C5 TaxID=2689108 RepID=UPI001C0B119D|nr:glutamine--tRNA ligase/YqeY domain fusion protein [Polynucleobacter sp. MWH-Loch1C5]MBU3542794.1 glutamine--tRNA ligase/YqeY domain fusion protein [Polynucleobacter sp. MWH-Loch1C5]